jgi:3-methyladenine DNA glycosylase AlkC
MYDLEELINFVTDSINNNKDDYLDDEEKFVKKSIEEFLDDSNSSFINSIFNDIEDTLYENI